MSTRATAAIRLGVEGGAEVKSTFQEIGNEGDAVANRWSRSFDRASNDVQAAMRRQALAASKLADIQPATPMQRRVHDAASSNYTGDSAREAARNFTILINEQERLERQAHASRAALALLDQQMSTRGMGEAARSAEVFSASFADLENRARTFLTAIDPAFAAQQRFNSEMGEARALISVGAISLDQYCDKLRLEQVALDQSTAARRRNGVSAGQQRAATQQVAYSIGDFATQVGMGQTVLFAFTSQMNQTIQAIGLMQKEAKGLIGFMAGPYGAVIQGTILIGGMLIGKWLDGSEAAKAKEKAAKELTDQMDRLYESNMRAVKSEQRLQQETLNTAYSMWQKAEATRLATQQRLKDALIDAKVAQLADMAGGTGTSQQARTGQRVSDLEKQLADNEHSVAKNWASVQAARIPILQGIASETDKATASTRRFDRASDALNNRLMLGKITGTEYAREFGKLKAAHDAEQDAIAKSEKKVRGKTDADRAAAKAQREAQRDAKDYLRDLEAIQDRYDPLTAASRRYREELEKIAALRGKDAESADLYRRGARDAYLKERAAILGDAIDMESVRGEGEREEERSRRIEQRKQDLADQIALVEREYQLVAANDNIRDRELATLRFIQELKRDLPDLTAEETTALVAQHERLLDIADATAKARRGWEEWKGFASSALDDIFNPDNWSNWGDLGKKILRDLAREFVMLAALNPLKNMLFGSELPTLGGFLGAIGKTGGSGLMGTGGVFGSPHKFGGFGLSLLGITGFNTGTEYAPGGWAILGENGPELGYLPRGSKVQSTSASRQALEGGMGGIKLSIDASIHAPGADAAALARVEANQQRLIADLPSKIVEVVSDVQGRIRRPLGLAA